MEKSKIDSNLTTAREGNKWPPFFKVPNEPGFLCLSGVKNLNFYLELISAFAAAYLKNIMID